MLMREQASFYRDRLSVVLNVAQPRREYLGSFGVRTGEDGHSLHHGGEDSDKEREGRTPAQEGDDPRDDVAVVHPSPCLS